MLLTLKRESSNDACTFGKLYVNGKYECETLEDVERPEKIKGETAFARGRYKVIVSYSPRFKRMLPLLLNTPDFIGVRIHPGNTRRDTEGCILVGQSRGKNAIVNSRKAFDALYAKLYAASKREEIIIEVV